MARHGIRVTVAAVSALVLAGLVTPVASAAESAPSAQILANAAAQNTQQTSNNTATNAGASGSTTADNSTSGSGSVANSASPANTTATNSSAAAGAATDSTAKSGSSATNNTSTNSATPNSTVDSSKTANSDKTANTNNESPSDNSTSDDNTDTTDPKPYPIDEAIKLLDEIPGISTYKQADGTYKIGDPIPGGTANHSPNPSLDKYYSQKIRIYSSYADPSFSHSGEAGYMIAPIDYAHPEQGNMLLLVSIAKPLSGNSKGVIAINNGGPGGDAANYAAWIAQQVNSNPNLEFLRDYTIVGVTPRGVYPSVPFSECQPANYNPNDTTGKSYADGFDVDKKTQENVNSVKQYVNQCFTYTGQALGWDDAAKENFLRHIGTVDSVKDLDLLRSVMGQDKLNYIGLSYGSRLGYEYLRQFAANAGKIAIDGIVGPNDGVAPAADQQTTNLTDEQLRSMFSYLLGQAAAYQDTYEQFAKWCYTQDKCPLSLDSVQPHEGDYADDSASVSLATKQLQNITRPLLYTPYHLYHWSYDNSDQYLQFSDVTSMVRSALYLKANWPYMKDALYELATGVQEGSGMQALYGRTAKRGYRDYASGYAFSTISCADRANRALNSVEIQTRVNRLFYQATPFSDPGAPFNQAGDLNTCNDWRFDGTLPAGVELPNLSNILVVSTTHDNATAYENGPAMAKLLYAPLLTVEGAQHVAFSRTEPGYECVARAYDNFFNKGTIESDGTVDGICSYKSFAAAPVVDNGNTNQPGNTDNSTTTPNTDNAGNTGNTGNTSTNTNTGAADGNANGNNNGNGTAASTTNDGKSASNAKDTKSAKGANTAKTSADSKFAATGATVESAVLMMVTVALFGAVLLLSAKREALAEAFRGARGRSVVAHHAKK